MKQTILTVALAILVGALIYKISKGFIKPTVSLSNHQQELIELYTKLEDPSGSPANTAERKIFLSNPKQLRQSYLNILSQLRGLNINPQASDISMNILEEASNWRENPKKERIFDLLESAWIIGTSRFSNLSGSQKEDQLARLAQVYRAMKSISPNKVQKIKSQIKDDKLINEIETRI